MTMGLLRDIALEITDLRAAAAGYIKNATTEDLVEELRSRDAVLLEQQVIAAEPGFFATLWQRVENEIPMDLHAEIETGRRAVIADYLAEKDRTAPLTEGENFRAMAMATRSVGKGQADPLVRVLVMGIANLTYDISVAVGCHREPIKPGGHAGGHSPGVSFPTGQGVPKG